MKCVLQQWADTKNTTNFITNAIDNNFLPENAPVIENYCRVN